MTTRFRSNHAQPVSASRGDSQTAQVFRAFEVFVACGPFMALRALAVNLTRMARTARKARAARVLATFLAVFAVVTAAIGALAGSASAGEFHEAVRAGDLERVSRMLAEDPARVDARDSDRYAYFPLHIAAREGHLDVAARLLDAGAEIDAGDSDDSTPLHVAALGGQAEMVAFLIERGADIARRDHNGAYSLSFAASAGDPATVQTLLDAGADLYHRDRNGFTLLHYAAMRGLDALADSLLAAGEPIDAQTRWGDTPLRWATVRGNTAMMRKLLGHGANPNAAAPNGSTCLMRAAQRGLLEPMRLLLAWGADPLHRDNWGRDALFETCWDGNARCAELLLGHGASPSEPDSNGSRPLFQAVRSGHADLAGVLLDAGADPNLIDQPYGMAPLHFAAVNGHEDIAARILDAGCDASLRTAGGATALDLAQRYGHRSLARMLRGRGVPGSTPGGVQVGTPGGAPDGETGDEMDRGAVPIESLADLADLPEGEAVIWYLRHSGWGIKTRDHLLVFDYFENRRGPDEPGLCNGHILPSELAGENVTVFVSHVHGDHYDPRIWSWREQIPGITYVMGFDPEVPGDPRAPAVPEGGLPPFELMGPRQQRIVGDVKVTTIEANDTGVGFVVEADGLVIFHAGDHANRMRDLSGTYPPEIEWLKAQGVRPDIAFLPVSGCNFGDQVAVKIGLHYTLETLEPRCFFPMHNGDYGVRYPEIVEECREIYPRVRADYPCAPGDRFHYRDGDLAHLASRGD